jgi:DNA primase
MNTISKDNLDYAAIKQAVSIEQILNHYGAGETLRRSGVNLFGACPLHGGHNKDQFHASLVNNSWFCFGDCQRGGSILDFVKRKEGVDIREAAELIRSWFTIPNTGQKANGRRRNGGHGEPIKRAIREKPIKPLRNRPLGFTLRRLDPAHPYLKERGLTPETITAFGVGYCGSGSMSGRIAIPIHNRDGQLVAYAGRWPGVAPDQRPRYKVPRGFRKSLEVFNLHRAMTADPGLPLIVVEGYFGCMKIWQAGFHRVVAIMGCCMSEMQAARIGEAAGESDKVRLLFDNDESGHMGVSRARGQLKTFVKVEVIELSETEQPPDCLSSEAIRALLT